MIGWEKSIVYADTQGVYRHEESINALVDCIKDFRPKYVFALGDIIDSPQLRNGANEDDKAISYSKDIEMGLDVLERTGTTHYFKGNHEYRCDKMRNSPIEAKRDLANMLWDSVDKYLKKNNCMVFPYHAEKGMFEYGNFTLVHGYMANMHSTYAHAQTYGNCIVGHNHRTEISPSKRSDRGVGYGLGCLCELDLEYNETRPGQFRWTRSFIKMFHNTKTGVVVPVHVQEIPGSPGVYLDPTEQVFRSGLRGVTPNG